MAFYTLGIENAWTLAGWFKPARDTHDECLMDFAPETGNADRITVTKLGTVSNDPLEVKVYDELGTLFKHYTFDSVVPASAWHLVVVRWDGALLKVIVDGVLQTPTALTVDTGGAMGVTERVPVVANNAEHTAPFSGLGYYVALWSTDTGGPSMMALYENPTAWLRDPIGNYDADDVASLVHWWRLGEAAHNEFEGTTWVIDAVLFNGIDLSTGAANLADADKVAEQPSTPVTHFLMATFALDLTLAGSLTGRKIVRAALVFDGTLDYLANTTPQDWGIANAWTIAMAICKNPIDMGGSSEALFSLFPTVGNINKITIGFTSGNQQLNVKLWDSAGATTKQYHWTSLVNDGVGGRWMNLLIRWDGTNLDAFVNSAKNPVTPTKSLDVANVMTNTNRKGVRGCGTVLSAQEAGAMQFLAIWDEAVSDAEAAQLSLDPCQYDLRWDYGNYASAANLKHYFRPGLAPNTNEDGPSWMADAIDASGIDFYANGASLSAADVKTGDSWYPYRPSFRSHCLTFNGTDEYISQATGRSLFTGVGGDFSIKFTAKSTRNTHDETLFDFRTTTGGGTNNGRIRIEKLGTVSGDPLQITIYTTGGAVTKRYQWNSALPSGTWKTYTFSYETTGDTLKLYDHTGSLVTPDATPVDTSTNWGAQVYILATAAAYDATNFFQGNIRQLAWFNNQLTANQLLLKTDHYDDLWEIDNTDWKMDDTTTGLRTVCGWILYGLEDLQLGPPADAWDFAMYAPGRNVIAQNGRPDFTFNNIDASNMSTDSP